MGALELPIVRWQVLRWSSNYTNKKGTAVLVNESLLNINHLWLLLCALLVLLMQVGFLLLEDGQVRRKNSANIAMKNLADLALSLLLFWCFGFAVMFAGDLAGLVGNLFYSSAESEFTLAFVFQMMFAGTAATIVSGAVAERMRFGGYLLVTLLVGALIYPVFGHWVWAGQVALPGAQSGWLASLGYVDFAGATVVHAIGGWVALAAIIVIGPRTGRFDKGAQPLKGQNQPLTTAGVMVLMIGWIGFNGGSASGFGAEALQVVANTLLAGLVGASVGIAWSWQRYGSPQLLASLNGLLAGLVSVTALAHAIDFQAVVVVAVVGAWLASVASEWLASLGLDDVVGAVSVHAVAGSWGCLAVALFADPLVINTGLAITEQLMVQLLGVLVAGFWAFGVAYIVLRVLNQLWPLRVQVVQEHYGLDFAEHGDGGESVDLLRVMEARDAIGQRMALTVDPLSDLAEVAAQYNALIAEVSKARDKLWQSNQQLEVRVLERTSELAAEVEQRREVEIDLLAAREQALRAAQAKTEFLATMSHEIRTPMNGVVGMLEVLRQSTLDQEQVQLVEVAAGSGETLLQIIDDILDFSKIEAGQLKVESVSFSPHAVIEDVSMLLMGKVRDRGLELILDVHPDVPEQVVGDPLRWRQILVNLVGNAVKFTERGTITMSLSVVQSAGGSAELLLAVQDTGVGIGARAQKRLFEPFVQADSSTTRRFGGTGLGLSICSRLVAMMGGQIGVQSSLGEGARFWVSMQAEIVQPAQASNIDLNGITVLLIDDCEKSREVLGRHLRDAGARVLAMSGGLNALAELKASPNIAFDVAVVDQEMGAMSGLELAHALAQLDGWHAHPALLMTRYDMLDLTDVAAKLGYGECLQKPLLRDKLLRAVARSIGRADEQEVTPQALRKQLKYRAVDVERAEVKGALILVAEDNPVNAKVIATMMQQLGLVVHVVSNGREAWRRLQEQTYGLLITDCHMPVMDGYQLAQKIRRQEEHQGWYLPIVALTAGAMESDAQRCYAMGMDDYLTKPVTLAVLNAMVVKHLPVVDDMRVLVDEVNDVVPEAHVVANNGHIEDAVLAHEGLGSVVEQTIDVVLIKQTFGDDLVMMQEMLHLFLDTTRPLVDLAVANMQAQKWQQARDAVHEMIGAAGAAGAPALARTGQEAEALLHAEDFVAAALAVGRLPVQFDACDVAIKAFLKQQSQA